MRPVLKTTFGAAFVAIGGAIYLLCRTPALLIYQIARMAGLDPLLQQWRNHTLSWGWPEWVVYCLPDGLWSAGYVLMVDGLFRPHPYKWLVAGVIPLVGVLSEMLQLAGWLPGTFDVIDVVCYAVPYLLYLLWKWALCKKEYKQYQ